MHSELPASVSDRPHVFASEEALKDPRTVLHWSDLLCPFCYVAQSRNEILRRRGFLVIELPFEVHPDIPPTGLAVGPRHGPMYAGLEREAAEAGLTLHWPARLPNTRVALAATEWVRREYPDAFPQVHRQLFEAHFVRGEDLGDVTLIRRYMSQLGIDLDRLQRAMEDGSAMQAVQESEALAWRVGARSTPAWFVNGRLISGLLPRADFEKC